MCIFHASFLVMCQCWHVDPDQRPTFSELASFVDQLLGSVAEYTELRMVLPEPSDNELGVCLQQ